MKVINFYQGPLIEFQTHLREGCLHGKVCPPTMSADIARRVGYIREDYWIPKRG